MNTQLFHPSRAICRGRGNRTPTPVTECRGLRGGFTRRFCLYFAVPIPDCKKEAAGATQLTDNLVIMALKIVDSSSAQAYCTSQRVYILFQEVNERFESQGSRRHYLIKITTLSLSLWKDGDSNPVAFFLPTRWLLL